MVGAQYQPITGERDLVTVSGARPPASYDLATLVKLQVNANGEAEWVVLGGSAPRREVIPWRGER